MRIWNWLLIAACVLANGIAERSAGGQEQKSEKNEKSDGKSNGDGRSKDGKSASGKSEGDGKPMEPEVTVRPVLPSTPPNPQELKLRPDPNGKVRFNFRGQPWPDVLNWLAEISGMSFDWQELPADYLNLTTQRSYSIDEARDLVNRHLLARGFTMLESDELLTVVSVKKLDAGMVPRVEPQELSKRRPHEFVKVSFPLDSLLAEGAVEELKPMMSPNGKLTALKSTNRLEAMDAVSNLREIYKVIGQEQSDEGQERLVREFDLQFAKAAEVQLQLQKLLGMEDKQSNQSMNNMSRDQIQQMLQQQEVMIQMQRGGGDGRSRSSSPFGSQKPEINLVVNLRRNSILARANPDKMAVIAQAIKMLDVQIENTQTLLGNLSRMQIYRLAALDPATVIKMLEDSGGLDPTTRLQVDEKNKAIVAHASLADHMMIRQVVEKLDGSGRKFEVISLRRLEADYVAGTIEFMMSGGPEDKSQQRNNNSSYSGYDSYRRSDSSKETTPDKFRVDADVENNRLLLWANDIELQEVRNLLIKLGEITDRRSGASASKVRVLQVPPGPDAVEFLEKLRTAWPSVAPNPLIVPKPAANNSSKDVSTPDNDEQKPVTPVAPAIAPQSNLKANSAQLSPFAPRKDDAFAERKPTISDAPVAKQPWQAFVRLAQLNDETSPQKPATEPPVAAPPVRIEFTSDGRLVVASQDGEALDLLEELVEQLAPDRRDFQVFKLKHASSYWVKLNLLEFFEEEDKSKKNPNSRTYYFYDSPSSQDKQQPRHRLSKRKTLKFISDPDTNTIVVIGADPAQLKTIQELIELYDRPEPTDSKSARMTSLVQIKWGNATGIADAIKDVYRDLLSANDKALQQANPEQKNRPQSQNTYIIGGESDEKDKRTPVSFKGKLSIGIDEISNTLLVSADGENLLNNVLKMVESLDAAARPSSTVQVLKIGGGMNSAEVKRVLEGLLSEEGSKGQPARSLNGNSRQQQSGQRNQAGSKSQPNGND